MKDQAATEPSFEEALAAQKEPSFEEMLSAQKDISDLPVPDTEEGGSALSVFEEPFTPVEAGLRSARQAFKGASIGLSEPVFGASAAVTGAVEDLVSGGEIKSAQDVLDTAKARYKQDIERQEKLVAEYPIMSMGQELLGGLAPLSPSVKLAGAGLEAVSSLPALLKQAAITGAATGGVMESAEQIKRAPYEELSIPESAKRLATSAGIGGVVGGVIGAAPAAIGKAITSEPSLMKVQTILGPPKQVQRQYMERVKEIESLPSDEAVIKFFDDVRTSLFEQERLTVSKIANATENVAALETRLAARESSAKADQRDRLKIAREELRSIKEDLNREKAIAQRDLDRERQILERDLVDPEFVPHIGRVQDALESLKEKIFLKSSEAVELLPKEPVFPRDEILRSLARERATLTKGAGRAIVPEVISAQSLLDGIYREVEQMAPLLSGPEVKGVIKQIDLQVSQMKPGKYAKLADVPLYQARKYIDGVLKGISPEYKQFMEREVAPVAAFHDEALGLLKSPSAIVSETKKSLKEPEIGKVFARLRDETGIDTVETIAELADRRQARSLKNWMLEATPEAQEIKRLQSLIDMTRLQNFNSAVFNTVADTESGQAIIGLRRMISMMQNRELQEKEIEALLASGRIELSEANALKANLNKELESIGALVDPMRRDEKGAQTLATLLRQASGPVETRQASRLVEAMTQLPEEQFGELFSSINVLKPENFERFAENLRIRRAMDMPRTQGSRRVQLMNSIIGAVADKAGLAKGGPFIKAIGGFLGAYFDEFGGDAAKAYLKAGMALQGIPTVDKFTKAAPIPMGPRLKNYIAGYVGNIAANTDPNELVQVSEQQQAAVAQDIQRSKLSSVEKAKAVNELSKLGMVSGKYLRKIMLEASVKEARAEEFEQKIMEELKEKQSETVKQDKPDVLKNMMGPKR
jgi:hypothetical protein